MGSDPKNFIRLSRQSGMERPKVRLIFSFESTEYAGRVALVGYWSVVRGRMVTSWSRRPRARAWV